MLVVMLALVIVGSVLALVEFIHSGGFSFGSSADDDFAASSAALNTSATAFDGADDDAPETDTAGVWKRLEYALLMIFTVELVLRMHCHVSVYGDLKAFLNSGFCMIDLVVVLLDYAVLLYE